MVITDPVDASRNCKFDDTFHIEYLGDPLPLDGADVHFEVRQYEGQAGDPLLADADVAIISDTLIGKAIDPVDGLEKDLRLLILQPEISKADMAGLPGQNQPDAGDPQTFMFELMIIYADDERDTLWLAPFIVYPGVVA